MYTKVVTLFISLFLFQQGLAQDYFADLQKASAYMQAKENQVMQVDYSYHFLKNDSLAKEPGAHLKVHEKDVYLTRSYGDYTLKTKQRMISTSQYAKAIYVQELDRDFYKEEKIELPRQMDTTGLGKYADSVKQAMTKIFVYKGVKDGLKKYSVVSGGNYDSTLYYFEHGGVLAGIDYYVKERLNNNEGKVKVTLRYRYNQGYDKNCLKEEYYVVYDRKTRSYKASENFKDYQIIYVHENL